MMNKVEEHPLPYTSPSVVTFHSLIDENDQKSKSVWDPDWTIQREISITIDKSVKDPPKFCSKKIRIICVVTVCVIIILSVVIPIIVTTIKSQWTSTKRTTTTTIETTQINLNSSNRNLEIYSCENLIYLENINLIGYDLMSESSMTWSRCCSWCLNVLSCRAFTYETISSKCYLKTMTNDNEIFDKGYKSGKYL